MSKRVSDFQPKQFDLAEWRKVPQVLDVDFELIEVQFRQGMKGGEYACMKCKDLTTGKEFGLNSGGKVVVKQIKEAISRASLPLMMKIHDNGKYQIVQ